MAPGRGGVGQGCVGDVIIVVAILLTLADARRRRNVGRLSSGRVDAGESPVENRTSERREVQAHVGILEVQADDADTRDGAAGPPGTDAGAGRPSRPRSPA